MITVDEIKKKALAKYSDFLLSFYNDTLSEFFPFIIPCNKGNPNDDFEKRSEELKLIHQNSKNNGKKSAKLFAKLLLKLVTKMPELWNFCMKTDASILWK